MAEAALKRDIDYHLMHQIITKLPDISGFSKTKAMIEQHWFLNPCLWPGEPAQAWKPGGESVVSFVGENCSLRMKVTQPALRCPGCGTESL